MKKIKNIVFVIALCMNLIPIVSTSSVIVSAKDSYSSYYPMQCGNNYEVAIVNDSGQFTKQGCYASFSEAKSAMAKSGNDAVVRHASSYSPTKIIAMNSGVVYSYPMRDGSSTMTVKQHGTSAYDRKTTYITKHHELAYWSTDSYDGNGNGSVHVTVTGFDGDVDLKDVDLVPYKFITNNLSVYLGGNDTTSENEQPFSVRIQQAYYSVVQNGNYKELRFTAYWGWATNGDVPNKVFDSVVGPAADWMNVGDVYYSYNDYDFYTDRYYTNKAGTYYNYYQFMTLRQKSSIPASAYNTFISQKGYGSDSVLWDSGQYFINAQENYGINALLLFAQAACESGWGTSTYAKQRYNLFGWNAVDSDPNQATYFSSVEQCINEQAGIHLREYISTADGRYFGSHFGNKGSGITVKYASSPYYGLTISSIAYNCDKIYNNYSGDLTEFNEQSIGVVNTYAAGIYNQVNGTQMFTTEYGPTYQNNFTVTILGESDGWYKIQSTNYLSNGTQYNTKDASLITYDWNTNVGWIQKDKVTVISGKVSSSITTDITDTGVIGTATVNVSGLRIRKGPGLGYASNGYASEGTTYNVFAVQQADGYTWYQCGTDQWFSSKDGWVTYTEKSADITPPSTDVVDANAITQAQQIDTPSEDRSMLAGIQTITYDSEKHVVTLTGMALYTGMDAAEGNVKHELLLSDPETKKSKVIPCTTFNYSGTLFDDGHNYSAICFTVSLDLDDFEDCNYNLGVRLTNGNTSGYYSFFMTSTKNNQSYKKDDGTFVKFFADPISNYRLQISAEKQSIDMSVINKPSNLTAMFGTTSLNLANGHIQMNALAAIYGTDFTNETDPTYEVILEAEDGTAYTYETSLSSDQMDITSMMDKKHTYNKCCFNTDMDISNLKAGTYRIYIHAKTTGSEDIFEMYSIQAFNTLSETFNGKTYTIQKSNVRSRLLLTIV